MKRAIFLIIIVGAFLVMAYSGLFISDRFRLRSPSPSGESNVFGLAFQGSKQHALDGTLRLFVRDEADASGVWKTKIQTNIEWGRDLAIIWKKTGDSDAFAIMKSDKELMGFVIAGDGVVCTSGRQFLALDPYKEIE